MLRITCHSKHVNSDMSGVTCWEWHVKIDMSRVTLRVTSQELQVNYDKSILQNIHGAGLKSQIQVKSYKLQVKSQEWQVITS